MAPSGECKLSVHVGDRQTDGRTDVVILRSPIRLLLLCRVCLTLWRLLLPYGYSYKASCVRPETGWSCHL